MRRKPIFPINETELADLSTKELLARLKQLQKCEGFFEGSDMYDWEVPAGQIVFKNSPEWETAYCEVKAVLARREHVPRGTKAKRIQNQARRVASRAGKRDRL